MLTFEALNTSLQPLIQFLHTHPHYSGIFSFFVVFCETLAVVGIFLPGTIVMTAIGVLIGSQVIPATNTIVLAILGAISGDYVSYWWGRHYKDRMHLIWPFRKHPKLLTHGENFFAKHGGKSIMIGRFAAPLRSMIPMVAGMLNMSPGRFILAAIPSASLWAICYILPGVLLGTLAMSLPPKVATQFMFWMILILLAVWCIVWLAQHFLKRLCHFIDDYIRMLWNYLKRKRKLRWIPKFLSDPRYVDNHKQLTLLLAACLTFCLFILVLISVKNQNFLTAFNQPCYHLLQSIRTNKIDSMMLFFTFLAETKALIIAQLIFIGYLAWKRYWYVLIHAAAILFIFLGGVWCTKTITHIPRPNGLLISSKDFSFPSGHVAGSIMIYGFLAVVIARELKKNLCWIPYTFVAVITTLVMISRLYLGAHWLTDILGAIFLSLTVLFCITISYHRHHNIKLSPLKTIIYATVIFAATLIIHASHSFQYQLIHYYWPYSQTKTITLKSWKAQTNDKLLPLIPLYRPDRLGHPINAFNIQWVGDLNDIERALVNRGWQSYRAHFNLQEILFRLTNIHSSTERLPILTQLYDNHPEVLLMTKKLADGNTVILLRLWNANIAFTDSPQNLWIGVIDYYEPPDKLLNNFKKDKQHEKKFTGAVDKLIPDLNSFRWRKILDNTDKQPDETRLLKWDGGMLLIEPDKYNY